MKKGKLKKYSFMDFLWFFLLIGFVLTVSFKLFFTYASHVDSKELRIAALVTFGNAVFLSLLMSLADYLRRLVTVERPLRKILDATELLSQGSFDVRIDASQRSLGTAELRAIAKNFNQMAEELAGIEVLRTDFISNVSHELKTPLAVMQNYGTLLQQPLLPDEKRIEYAKTITEASRRLSGLISNILKLNKLENQQIYPNRLSFDLGEQLCEDLLAFEDVWEKRRLNIETDIADAVFIVADPELLSLVWNNLFSNAIKFTPEGGTVSLCMKTDGGSAVVDISDTGCGMSEETMKRMFDKFYQGDASHATQGNGLGLALVRRVIDIMKGEITVKSQEGVGTTFTVKLRRNPDEKVENAAG